MVKSLPATQETRVQSLGREDLLEKEMATHYSTLAWRIPWMEEPGRLQFMQFRCNYFFHLKYEHMKKKTQSKILEKQLYDHISIIAYFFLSLLNNIPNWVSS